MLWPSSSLVSFFAMAGAAPPALEVEKNKGSIKSKSFSACIRSIRTEPTMPRQPTKPTRFPIFFMGLPFQSMCF